MSIGIRPLGSRVLIKKLDAEEKTAGGIILTSSAKEAPQIAEVMAVGAGTEDEKWNFLLEIKLYFQSMQELKLSMMERSTPYLIKRIFWQ